MLERIACPGSRADSAVKTRYVVPCGLALATSQPLAQHDTGPGYSCARRETLLRWALPALCGSSGSSPGTASRGRGAPAGTRDAG